MGESSVGWAGGIGGTEKEVGSELESARSASRGPMTPDARSLEFAGEVDDDTLCTLPGEVDSLVNAGSGGRMGVQRYSHPSILLSAGTLEVSEVMDKIEMSVDKEFIVTSPNSSAGSLKCSAGGMEPDLVVLMTFSRARSFPVRTIPTDPKRRRRRVTRLPIL